MSRLTLAKAGRDHRRAWKSLPRARQAARIHRDTEAFHGDTRRAGTLGGGVLVYILKRYELISLPGNVYFTDTLPVAMDFTDLALIIVLSLLISFAATIYPARQAARLLPVEAIRHD